MTNMTYINYRHRGIAYRFANLKRTDDVSFYFALDIATGSFMVSHHQYQRLVIGSKNIRRQS